MYTYKCYYHPKEDGGQSCRGCKLPLCAGCQGLEGFCPECEKKRAAVEQLKRLRMAMQAHPTATTTGRLRLARQSAQGGSRKLAASGALGPKTRPLQPLPPSGSSALPPMPQGPLRPARQAPERPQERRYNGDRVAYKPVAQRTDRYVQPRRKAPAKKASAPQAVRPAWFTPFVVGLGVGVLLMVFMLLAQPFMRAPVQPKPVAATQLTAHEEAFLDRAVNAQRVDTLADPVAPRRVVSAGSHLTARRHAPAPRRSFARPASRPQGKRQPSLEEAMVFHTVSTP